MRVVLFDAILESHVTESLARAFRAAGHEVLSTGRLHHGHRFSTDDALAALWAPTPFDGDFSICSRPAPVRSVPAARRRPATVGQAMKA